MRIKWLRRAVLDLEAAERFVAEDNPEAARQQSLKILRAVSLLIERPGLGRVGRIAGTRELVVSGTPFVVPYRVAENVIQILRVYHTSRKWPDEI